MSGIERVISRSAIPHALALERRDQSGELYGLTSHLPLTRSCATVAHGHRLWARNASGREPARLVSGRPVNDQDVERVTRVHRYHRPSASKALGCAPAAFRSESFWVKLLGDLPQNRLSPVGLVDGQLSAIARLVRVVAERPLEKSVGLSRSEVAFPSLLRGHQPRGQRYLYGFQTGLAGPPACAKPLGSFSG